MSISSFSSHLMMSLQGDELHFFVSGLKSIENPSIEILNLANAADLKSLDVMAENHYSSVVLSFYSPVKTLIPEGIFDQNHLKNYLKYNFGSSLSANDYISDYIGQLESHLVYAASTNINSISSRFPSLRMKHAISILLEAHLRSSIATERMELTAYSEGKSLDLIVSDKNKLLYSNTFNVFNAEDFTYYIVYVMDILGASLKESLVRLCGDTPQDGFDLLKKYCPNAGYHRFGYDNNMDKKIKGDDYAREAVLLNQYQCV